MNIYKRKINVKAKSLAGEQKTPAFQFAMIL